MENPEALGRHLLIECMACAPEILNRVVLVEQIMREAARQLGVKMVGSNFHHFAPYGVSGVILIEESHLTIHTWPEYGYAAIDFFTCGPTADPAVALRYLQNALQAQKIREQTILRGEVAQLPQLPHSLTEDRQKPVGERQVWFTDRDENVAISLRHRGDLLFQKRSPIQLVEVYDTFEFGRMLSLDSVIMCTEKDEPGYHEMLVHVPMQSFSAQPERVMIIGGGDGGTARELVRYPKIEEIQIIEIDPVVIEAVEEHIPSLSASFHDPRVQIHIAEGFTYLQKAPSNQFDLLLIDAPDPEGPAAVLFSAAFYQEAFRVLKPGGILITQSESPYYRSDAFLACRARMGQIFGTDHLQSFLTFIPTYTSGMWSFTIASKEAKIDFSTPYAGRFPIPGLRYYNQQVHQAAFALPNFVQQMIKEQ